MLETFITFVKSFPLWLYTIVEVLVVAVLFASACLFLFGVYIGIRMIGSKAPQIKKIIFFPIPSIEYYEEDDDGK
jgi:uncharacterized membrane protein YfcA